MSDSIVPPPTMMMSLSLHVADGLSLGVFAGGRAGVARSRRGGQLGLTLTLTLRGRRYGVRHGVGVNP